MHSFIHSFIHLSVLASILSSNILSISRGAGPPKLSAFRARDARDLGAEVAGRPPPSKPGLPRNLEPEPPLEQGGVGGRKGRTHLIKSVPGDGLKQTKSTSFQAAGTYRPSPRPPRTLLCGRLRRVPATKPCSCPSPRPSRGSPSFEARLDADFSGPPLRPGSL